jgi:HMG (high mobility group) box/HMG-box domain
LFIFRCFVILISEYENTHLRTANYELSKLIIHQLFMSVQELTKLYKNLSPDGQKSIMEDLEERRQKDLEKTLQSQIDDYTPEQRKELAAMIGKGGKKRERTPKDPLAPKWAKTAYFLFQEKVIPGIKEDEGITHTEAQKKAGELWKNLSEKKKKVYEDLHTKEKARYAKEMESYDPSSFDPSTVPVKKGRAKKDKDAPTRPRSSYILFSTEKRRELAKGGTPGKETMKIASELWKNLTDEEKAPYDLLHEEDKVRHEKEMAAYTKKKMMEEPTQEMDESE